ncbi:uncharacterized protein LOC111319262 [Stylophora pistillata]|uniref:uncharacterized protein LOC111319262 n=1 Tax=Stylophora pistillata TaxID=50429 RepID=UPI000C03CA32|nr:uncharacterized protein LOC111319262 [Stylophora pistillata]
MRIKTIKLSEAIDFEQFSNATKLFRVTALILKFIRNVKVARNRRREPQNKKPTLTVEEISEAKSLRIREIQEPMKHEKNFENLKQQRGLFSKDGKILKCKGRLGNAPLDIQGRQLLKKTPHQCVICKKLGLPYKAPKRADLPETRVTDIPTFTHVGVDFGGLLFTKTTRVTARTYICLFTCATSTVMHLPDLSSEAFIGGLQRFAGRRGIPASITSDNAKTFKGTNIDLTQLFRDMKAQDFATNQNITCKFILVKAPWWGGYYECMI